LKPQVEIDRLFYSCDSLISYALEVEISSITENVLKILETFLLKFKDKINIGEVNKSKGTKEYLKKLQLNFRSLYKLSRKDLELLKIFEAELSLNIFDSLYNEFEVFNIKNRRNLISIDFANGFRIVKCIDENIRNKIINPDEVIIKINIIKISFEHPWIESGVKTTFTQNDGFSRIDLLKCIYKGYKYIYNNHNLELDGVDMGIGGLIFSETKIKKILYSEKENLISVIIV